MSVIMWVWVFEREYMSVIMWVWVYECEYVSVSMWEFSMWVWVCEYLSVSMWVFECEYVRIWVSGRQCENVSLRWVYEFGYLSVSL